MYGGQCNCCGEQIPIFLCLDHVKDNGAEERKRLSGSKNANRHVYVRATEAYRPDEYQILCWNCNAAKTTGLPCPHKLGVEEWDMAVI